MTVNLDELEALREDVERWEAHYKDGPRATYEAVSHINAVDRFHDACVEHGPALISELRAARAEIERLREALDEAAPLASSLALYAGCNRSMGRVVEGQADKAEALHRIIQAALNKDAGK